MTVTVPDAAEFAAVLSRVTSLEARVAAIEAGPVPVPSTALFKTGFNPAVVLGAAGEFQLITGRDGTTGFEFKAGSVFACRDWRIQRLAGGLTQGIFDNAIEALTNPVGGATRALRLRMTAQQGIAQNALLLEPGEDVREFYYAMDLRLPDELPSRILADGQRNWLMVAEHKTGDLWNQGGFYGGDFRNQLSIMRYNSGEFVWTMRLDTNANDPSVPLVAIAQYYQNAPPPVSGGWYRIEHYTKRASDASGLTWWRIANRAQPSAAPVEMRFTGKNTGAKNKPINRIMLANLYSAGVHPLAYRVTNVEIRKTLP